MSRWIALASLFVPSLALAQSVTEVKAAPTSVVTIDVGHTSYGTVGLGFERAMGERWSLAAEADVVGDLDRSSSAQAGLGTAPGSSEVTMKTYGAALNVGLHLFPMGPAPEGLWLGPALFLDATRSELTFDAGPSTPSQDVRSDQLDYGAQAVVGYNFIAANGFTVAIAFDAGLRLTRASESSVNGPVLSIGDGFTLGTQLGLGWSI